MVDEPALATEPAVEPAVPPVATAQVPASEPLSELIAPAPTTAPSEPAQPVSEVDVAAEPRVEESKPEPKLASANAEAASAASRASSNTPSKAERNRELLQKANVKRRDNKQKNLDKIMAELEKRGKITNDEVEKLLRCSDATATRYLEELIKQGKIKRVGKTGAGVEYIKA